MIIYENHVPWTHKISLHKYYSCDVHRETSVSLILVRFPSIMMGVGCPTFNHDWSGVPYLQSWWEWGALLSIMMGVECLIFNHDGSGVLYLQSWWEWGALPLIMMGVGCLTFNHDGSGVPYRIALYLVRWCTWWNCSSLTGHQRRHDLWGCRGSGDGTRIIPRLQHHHWLVELGGWCHNARGWRGRHRWGTLRGARWGRLKHRGYKWWNMAEAPSGC